jgi:hypothetical protein
MGYDAVPGHARVGVSVSGPRGREYPYRWGLGRPLKPAERRTIIGHIVFTQPGVYAFYAASIVEGRSPHPADRVVSGLRVLNGPRRLPVNVRPPVPPTRISVNGDLVDSPQPPIILRGNVFVPIRFPAEALGAKVDWNSALRRVEIEKTGRQVQLGVGRLVAWVNGKRVTLYERPFIENERTYVPLRFVAESLGASVHWDGPTRTVQIRTG